MTPKISIIVPIYKAEKYLHRCLDSILQQTFTDWECILVDDGSPDHSGAICDEYAKRDCRFKVVHKENGGVSKARQSGLEMAQGEYVIHVDPDDWVDKVMLESLYNEATAGNYDVVIFNILKEYQDRKQILRQKPFSLDSKVILRELLEHKIHGSCVNKLVKRSVINDNSVTFPTDIICWEDLYFNCVLFTNQLKVSYIDEAFYHYDCYTSENSIVRKPSESRVQSQINFCHEMERLLDKDSAPLLYQSKSKTLLLVFRWRLYSKWNIKELFPEINDLFIRNNRYKLFDTEAFPVSTILRGINPQLWGGKIYKIYAFIANYTYAALRKLHFI